jgi:hypothetical protein
MRLRQPYMRGGISITTEHDKGHQWMVLVHRSEEHYVFVRVHHLVSRLRQCLLITEQLQRAQPFACPHVVVVIFTFNRFSNYSSVRILAHWNIRRLKFIVVAAI